jgi:hypothetical protein
MSMTLLAQRADRWELSSAAGWLAVYGGNITYAARAMNRSRPWVYKAKAALEKLLLPYSPDDDYLKGVR